MTDHSQGCRRAFTLITHVYRLSFDEGVTPVRIDDGSCGQVLLLRRDTQSGEQWLLLARAAEVFLNGESVILRACRLHDGDEITILGTGGQRRRYVFSA
jgi:hypothetical protein